MSYNRFLTSLPQIHVSVPVSDMTAPTVGGFGCLSGSLIRPTDCEVGWTDARGEICCVDDKDDTDDKSETSDETEDDEDEDYRDDTDEDDTDEDDKDDTDEDDRDDTDDTDAGG